MFHAILAATDRTSGRDPAVVTAARLAGMVKAPWSIIHVLESASLLNRRRILHFQTGEEQDADAAYRATVRRRLKSTYRDLLAWAPPCAIQITTGFPWKEIGHHAARIRADLIVMGPHATIRDPAGALRMLGRIGSTAEGVISRERCPVLIVRQQPCPPKPGFKKIIVGIDFSASCERALDFAGALARFCQSHVDLFHMLPIPPYPKYGPETYRADLKTTRARLKSFCHAYVGDLPHRYSLWGGALPYRELLKCAQNFHADAIVLGSHTKDQQGKWYAGSTVEKVTFQATCPVFVLTESPSGPQWAGRPSAAWSESDDNHTIQVFNPDHAGANRS